MTALAIDNFNRANAANLGANWTVAGSDQPLPIVSNQVTQPAATTGLEYYSGIAWPNDHYAQIVIKSLSTVTDEGMGPAVRVQSGGDVYFAQTNTHETRLYKRVSGAYTQMGSDAAACAVNDVLYIEAQGTTIVVKKNGTAIITVTSESSIASGNAGLWSSSGSTDTGDDWEGGNFSGVSGGGTGAYSDQPRRDVPVQQRQAA